LGFVVNACNLIIFLLNLGRGAQKKTRTAARAYLGVNISGPRGRPYPQDMKKNSKSQADFIQMSFSQEALISFEKGPGTSVGRMLYWRFFMAGR
jgi:hypothetical protein